VKEALARDPSHGGSQSLAREIRALLDEEGGSGVADEAFFLPCSGRSKQSPKRVRRETATYSGTRGESISQGRAGSSRAGRVKREKNPGRTAVSLGRPATRQQEQDSEVR
jgi:hypothetical protein